jgi:hypothetical protein
MSCCRRVAASTSDQISTIRPHSMRKMLMPVHVATWLNVVHRVIEPASHFARGQKMPRRDRVVRIVRGHAVGPMDL